MNVITIKQKLRKYGFYSSLVEVKKKILSFFYQVSFLKSFIMLNKRKGLRMSFLYQDHMILQCEEILSIKGEAIPGEWVTVSIAGQSKKICCQSDGRWEIELLPLAAGGPYTLEIVTPQKELIYRDVYAGEVWLCSGQSNMAVVMGKSQKYDKLVDGAIFRYFQMWAAWPTYPAKWNRWINRCVNSYLYIRTVAWNNCTSETIRKMSAIAYYYGEELSRQLGKPIGLILNPVGGTAEYCWIERRVLQKECPEILADWYENRKVTVWMKERAMQNLGGRYPEYEQLHPYHPGYCYETFIRPIKDFTIKGVIWFSGESSAQLNDTELFEKLQELLVRSWRESWNQCFPFYYVQLHGMNYEQTAGKGIHYYYPEIRNSQRRLLKRIPFSGMAVSYDLSVVNNVHFPVRKPVGERLARLALYNTYNKDIVPGGPLYHEAKLRDNFIYIKFDWSDGLCTKDGDEPKTFEVAGGDRCFCPAKAWIERDEIVLSCPEISNPSWVRYAFSEYPVNANLINGEGLPAACFEDPIEY